MRLYLNWRFSTFVLLLLLTSVCFLHAQQRRSIEIKRAGYARNLKKDGKTIRRIIGNVLIFYDGITLECDSVYDYSSTQRFDAFGNVVVSQQGTKLYGDVLYYDGNSRTGKIRGKIVRMVDEEAVLVTQFLDFNKSSNIANYFNGGVITTSDSKLSSDRGIYNSKTKQYYFGGNVALENPDFLINTDSLEYNSNTELANFHGPTRVFNPDGYIYSEKGWYNREEKKADFAVNAFIDYGAQKISGDKIFYDQENGFAHSQGNVVIVDTTQNTIIYGGEAQYWENSKDAMVTQNPLLVMVSDEGDSLYLRADKLVAKTIPYDESKPDSTYRILKGIGGVKFFRNDFQGICDSLVLNTSDSLLHMHVNPIVWNQDNQLSADHIVSRYKNNFIDRMFFKGSAFICSQEDSSRFNQIKGKEMEAYFKEGKLSKLDVMGNGQTVYYVRDKGQIVAANRAESVNLSISIREGTVSSILFRSKPTATLFPIDKAAYEDVTLVGFKWNVDFRPKHKHEIIPEELNLGNLSEVEKKAQRYKLLKKSPAETL